jgi:hypothetical protein
VFDRLSTVGESPAATKPLVAAAKNLVARWPSLPAADRRNLSLSFLHRVVTNGKGIQVLLDKFSLRKVLESGDKFTPPNLDGPPKSVDESNLICVTIEATLKRCGGEVHLIIPPNSNAGEAIAQQKTPLMKAIARAHSWHEKVLEGTAADVRALARHAGLTERYVGKVFKSAFLAPDIVEAILKGRQPVDLTFEKLCKHIPLSWMEQRVHFGFPPASR